MELSINLTGNSNLNRHAAESAEKEVQNFFLGVFGDLAVRRSFQRVNG
jgi:hypothetical protein